MIRATPIWTPLIVCAPLLTVSCGGGDPDSPAEISPALLESHVRTLASDDFEGRGAGYRGEAMAAEYIAERFREYGLAPIAPDLEGPRAYLQEFDLPVLEGPTPWEVLISRNVIGVLPGTDPTAGHIIIGAHFDGQGMAGQAELGRESGGDDAPPIDDHVWNSAVDNAVGVASVLEIARHMMESGLAPSRTILFVAFGAEESALNGSTHLANNPIRGHGRTAAMINLEKIVGDPDAEFLYVSYGTSPTFEEIANRLANETTTPLTPFFPGVVANTDHYPFVLSGVPAITMGTGSVDNVHTAFDHGDGLDYELLRDRTSFIAAYLAEAASDELPFEFTGDLSGRYGASGGAATSAETEARGLGEVTAFKIGSVVAASLAGRAGLQPGDLIVAIDDSPVPEQTFYLGLEDLFDEEARCSAMSLDVLRGDQPLTIELPPSC